MEQQSQNGTSQSELDLGLNQGENAKKAGVEPSILNKVTGGLFGKKDAMQSQLAMRKEPTFGPSSNVSSPNLQSAVNNTVNYLSNSTTTIATAIAPVIKTKEEPMAQPVENQTVEANPTEAVETQTQKVDTQTTEEVAAATAEAAPQDVQTEPQAEAMAATSNKASRKNPENWAIMQKLPVKHRRLFIAIAGAVAVLLALLWLKPSDSPVEEIQTNNGNNMPIEFQSLDPNKPVENADASNVVTTEMQPNQTVEANPQTTTTEQPTVEPAPTATVETPVAQPEPQAVAVPKVEPAKVSNNTAKSEQEEKARLAKLAAEKAKAEQLAKAKAEKLATDKAKAEQLAKAKAEKLAAEKAKAEQLAKAKAAEKAKQSGKAPVVEAKPAGNTAKASTNNTTATTASKATSKTLTVPPSTSLFQVFRSNGLDIRDANAMTKAPGAGNVLSSFKANDKIQVSVNSEGRVTSLRLSNGAVFTRQANGSYKYSK